MFIAYAYGRMIISIRESQSSLRSTQEKQDRVLVKRFAFIVGTDFLCWMPVIIIKFIALGGGLPCLVGYVAERGLLIGFEVFCNVKCFVE